MSIDGSLIQNRLLALMPKEAFQAIQADLEPCPIEVRTIMASPDTPFTHAHFILEGIASNTIRTTMGRRIEIGIVGREGMSNTSVVLGADRTPNESFMQVAGSSMRIPISKLREALASCEPLRAFLLLYLQVVSVQMARTVLSNGMFNIEERTARWLLMCQDRLDSERIPLTHEFLGIMLGVRRSGVTDTIHVLEGLEIIRGRRGVIEIRDRARLETIAGESYGAAEREYERLVGPWRGPSVPQPQHGVADDRRAPALAPALAAD